MNDLVLQGFYPKGPEGDSMRQKMDHNLAEPSCLGGCQLGRRGTIKVRTEKPEVPLNGRDIEKILARDLYSMSLEERESSLHDIHGVSEIMKEDPEFVQCKINELKIEISRQRRKSKAFQIAMIQSLEFV
jgi:hypothetical protein